MRRGQPENRVDGTQKRRPSQKKKKNGRRVGEEEENGPSEGRPKKEREFGGAFKNLRSLGETVKKDNNRSLP